MKKTTSGLLVVGLVLTLLAMPVAALAQTKTTNPFQDIPVKGTAPGGATFEGTLDITRFFVRKSGELTAQGDLTGTLTNAAGTVIGTVTDQAVKIPVTAKGTCKILHLELGPLDLNLLGLIVHLDKVVLDITAQQGPGNLLGNLLCAIAGLLDQGNLGAVAGALNQILAILG